MSTTDDANRIGALPRRADEVWRGAVLRLPMWIMELGTTPFRPSAAVWHTPRGVHMSPPSPPAEVTAAVVMRVLAELAADPALGGGRPGAVEVTDPALAAALGADLAAAGIEVAVRDRLPWIDVVRGDMRRHFAPGAPPGALAGKGVTIDRMRAYADAAAAFYRAAPWQHLNDYDLIDVDAAGLPSGGVPRYAVLMGSGGETFGLAFSRDLKEYERMVATGTMARGPKWSVILGPAHELTFDDHDLWLDAGLPLAGENAYPFAGAYDRANRRIDRPDAAELAYLEGLMCALAETTEDEIDRGRWARTVDTAVGRHEYQLSIPTLLGEADLPDDDDDDLPAFSPRQMESAMADIHRLIAESGLTSAEDINRLLDQQFKAGPPKRREPTTPKERAADLVDRAWETPGRRQIQLAREALALDPDNADAYVVLARRAGGSERAIERWAAGVAAGERALGKDAFAENAGHFWGILETRPYMRAKEGLAMELRKARRYEEALGHLDDMLHLNPGDNQGARYLIPQVLLALGRDEQLRTYLDRYRNDGDPIYAYTRALLDFRREGDSSAARQSLAAALRANRHVPQFVLGDAPPPRVETFSPGEPSEGAVCASELRGAWLATPGAPQWLETNTKAAAPARARRPASRRPKGAKGGKRKRGGR